MAPLTRRNERVASYPLDGGMLSLSVRGRSLIISVQISAQAKDAQVPGIHSRETSAAWKNYAGVHEMVM